MTKARLVFAGALIAFVAMGLLLLPAHVLAKKSQTKAKGLITAIDTVAGTLTVHDNKSDLDVTVNVDATTRIHLDNVEGAALTDLAVGDKAGVRYDTTSMLAKRIQAKSPKVKASHVNGTIAAIDTGLNTVTIQPASGDPVTVNVTDATKIERNDETATLTDLVVGDSAHAKYDPITMNAAHISAEGD